MCSCRFLSCDRWLGDLISVSSRSLMEAIFLIDCRCTMLMVAKVKLLNIFLNIRDAVSSFICRGVHQFRLCGLFVSWWSSERFCLLDLRVSREGWPKVVCIPR